MVLIRAHYRRTKNGKKCKVRSYHKKTKAKRNQGMGVYHSKKQNVAYESYPVVKPDGSLIKMTKKSTKTGWGKRKFTTNRSFFDPMLEENEGKQITGRQLMDKLDNNYPSFNKTVDIGPLQKWDFQQDQRESEGKIKQMELWKGVPVWPKDKFEVQKGKLIPTEIDDEGRAESLKPKRARKND